MKPINVGIIGYNSLCKGLLEVLNDNASIIIDKTGISVNITSISDTNIDKSNDPLIANIPIKTKTAMEIINNKDVDIVIELSNGHHEARVNILEAIKRGKHVVTANKPLLAIYGKELFSTAEKNNVIIGFEGSVGGGIPLVDVLKEDLIANNIKEIYGILNGTTNYILTRMEEKGVEFKNALEDAKILGYTENDPSIDINGIDSAYKLSILASIAFNALIPYDKIYIEGISRIKYVDIDFARQLGCKVKLLAIAKNYDGVEVRVHPTMIPDNSLLSKVVNEFNAISFLSDKAGKTIHYGRGAGYKATGSAVASDVISIAREITSDCINRVPLLGYTGEYVSNCKILDIEEIHSTFYLRFDALDEPGVLSTIAGVLGRNNISIGSSIQRGDRSVGDYVPLVFITHETTGGKISHAVNEIETLDLIKGETVIIRVEK